MEKNVPEWLLNGKKWTEEEEQQLLDEIQDGISKTEMSKRHERSIGSIRSKIVKMAIRMYNSKLPLAEIASKTKLSEEVIVQKANRRPGDKEENKVEPAQNEVALPKRSKKVKKEMNETKTSVASLDKEILEELKKLNKNMELLLSK